MVQLILSFLKVTHLLLKHLTKRARYPSSKNPSAKRREFGHEETICALFKCSKSLKTILKNFNMEALNALVLKMVAGLDLKGFEKMKEDIAKLSSSWPVPVKSNLN